MTHSHEYIYQQILKDYLDHYCVKDTDIDPLVINKAKFVARSLYITYVFVCNEMNGNKETKFNDISRWLNDNLANDCILATLIDEADTSLINKIERYDIPSYSNDIGTLYERLLNIETSGYKISNGKEYRNNLGSYYTPHNLAHILTSKTIDQYISNHKDKNAIYNAKIVDFSCGAGVFLTKAIKYIADISNDCEASIVMRKTACNIYACDVDCIALEIAKLNILKLINDFSLYPVLSKHFYHANFLIHSNKNTDIKSKLDTYMSGYIYHQTLAINSDVLQEYDIILGNPPWEKIRFEEKSFYSQYTNNLHNINFKFELPLLIEQTQRSNSKINQYATIYKNHLEKAKSQIKQSLFFKDSNNGELNTCTLFANAAYKLLSDNGVAGLVVKSSLVTSQVNKKFFEVIKYNINVIYDFINKNKIFDIDGRERFCLLILDRHKKENFLLGMNLRDIYEIDYNYTSVSIDDFAILNPTTKMLPNLYSIDDLKLLLKIYNQIPVFSDSFKNIKYGRLVHLTNHIKYIDKEPMLDNIPIYEGKFFTQFDGAYSGFNNVSIQDRFKSKAYSKKLSDVQKRNREYPISRFYIKQHKWELLSKQYNADYMLAWHSLTSASNARTCVATILPFIPASQSVQFLVTENTYDLLYLSGIFNSVVFDYIIKCKLNGIDLTQSILNQAPVPHIEYANSIVISEDKFYISAKDIILQICSLLLKSDIRLNEICKQVEITEKFIEKYTKEELIQLLDIVIARLYNLTPNEFNYILRRFEKQYCKGVAEKLILRYTALLKE